MSTNPVCLVSGSSSGIGAKIATHFASQGFNIVVNYNSGKERAEAIAKNAKEIHCVNSSFCHFVDRIESNQNLYYHHVRGSKLDLKKKWKIVNYAS